MKKIIALLLSLALFFGLFSGCTNKKQSNDDGKLNVLCTIFPEYDWAKNIIGERINDVNLTMLLDDGVDLHSFQPSVDDLIKISTCDLFIYVGGESDAWVSDALKQAVNKDMVVINLLDVLGDAVKQEELVEGMEGEEDEQDEIEYDEHVWLSVKNAELFTTYIAEQLCAIDADFSDVYEANAKNYIEKLEALDKEFGETVNGAKRNVILFADRFPFRYLIDDYALDYYAAFVGCSAETEASFKTIAFLSSKVDELGLKSIITLEGSEQKIAKTIIDNTATKDQTILTLNSMQGITSADIAAGETYFSIMTENLSVLNSALN